MPCTKLESFDKQNPNYKFLEDAIKDGTVTLDEDKCIAYINAAPLNLHFGWGMKAYLETQGYTGYVAFAHFPFGD
jgi:hypothetical protein